MKRSITKGHTKIKFSEYVKEIAKYSGLGFGDIRYILRIAEKIWLEHMRNEELVTIFPSGFQTYGFTIPAHKNWNVGKGCWETANPRLDVRYAITARLKRMLNEPAENRYDDDEEEFDDEGFEF